MYGGKRSTMLELNDCDVCVSKKKAATKISINHVPDPKDSGWELEKKVD